jgi:hypothetical protein
MSSDVKDWVLRPLVIVGFVVILNLFGEAILRPVSDRVLGRIIFKEAKREERLEDQLATAFNALQQNSQQVTQLLARGQREMAEIETTLRGLRQERAALELTPEQREVIKGLVRRQQTLREMLTSLDFWGGQVAVNACFFALGLITSWLDRRRRPRTPSGR